MTEYTIGEAAITIPLPSIQYLCKETQDPIMLFLSATVTWPNGELTEITKEDELHASFGLTLEGSESMNPSLTV